MSTPNKNNDTSNYDDGVCEMNDMLQNMSTVDVEETTLSLCANNFGKEGDDVNNICNQCKRVMYCSAACKRKHRHKHKKECEEHVRLAAEHTAKLHDEKLFKQPPPAEDCPICFIRLPSHETGSRYKSCCGKVICCGCVHAPVYDDQGNKVDNKKCPFCRVPKPSSNDKIIERVQKRMEKDDPIALYNIGIYYAEGIRGFRKNYDKALEYWHRAGQSGHADAYLNIGYAYNHGTGVEVDEKKAKYYYELAAMAGDADARHNLGINEGEAGNTERALKHHMIAVRAGDNDSLKEIQELYSEGDATKEDYKKALQSYQTYLGEIKSRQRDEAAAADEGYRYY